MTDNVLPKKVYDTLKYIAQIALPALATFIFTLSQIWGLPYGEQIEGTIIAVDTLLGALLLLDSIRYNKKKEGECNE